MRRVSSTRGAKVPEGAFAIFEDGESGCVRALASFRSQRARPVHRLLVDKLSSLIGDIAAGRLAATWRRRNFPRRILRLLAHQNSVAVRSSTSVSALSGASLLSDLRSHPAMNAIRKDIHPATARSIPRRHRPAAPRPRQGDPPLFPQGQSRPEARDKDPVLRRDQGIVRDRLEPAPMRRPHGPLRRAILNSPRRRAGGNRV